jgi:hypothetical protein
LALVRNEIGHRESGLAAQPEQEIKIIQEWRTKYGNCPCLRETDRRKRVRADDLLTEKARRVEQERNLKRPITIAYRTRGKKWTWKVIQEEITKGEIGERIVRSWVFQRPEVQQYIKKMSYASLPGKLIWTELSSNSGSFSFNDTL